MRTKTMLISALLGALSSVSVMAQTNVYSLNVVGYINVSIPPQWSILTCPLQCLPDNTLNTLLPNTNGYFNQVSPPLHTLVYAWTPGQGYLVQEEAVTTNANASGWRTGGADIALTPGSAVFIYNPFSTALSNTWVGTVTSGTNLVNPLLPGWNLVGSILPASGDLVTTSLISLTNGQKQDLLYTYDPVLSWAEYLYNAADAAWTAGGVTNDPVTTNITQGFFYYNTTRFVTATNNGWVESYNP